MIDQIANEILIAKEVMHTNNIDKIAGELQYAPILITNAVYAGERAGKLVFHRTTKTIDTGEDVEVAKLAVTPEFFGVGNADISLPEQVEQLIRNLNGDEIDMSVEELTTWLPGISPVKLKMLAYLNPNLAMYELADPKDKESVYTFITLKENLYIQWGKKQFKSKTKKTAKADK